VVGGLLHWFEIPMSDFNRGPTLQPPLQVDNIKIAPFICYEIGYPYMVLNYMPDANLLLTISDDSWFDKSIALAQHLQIARMRSLETGRYQMLNSSTGFTAVIDNMGRITALAPPFQTAVLTAKVQPMSGTTPWVNYVSEYWWTLAVISVALMPYFIVKNKKRKKPWQPT
jgi:apolipoprotein N-acyltransferase